MNGSLTEAQSEYVISSCDFGVVRFLYIYCFPGWLSFYVLVFFCCIDQWQLSSSYKAGSSESHEEELSSRCACVALSISRLSFVQ